MSESTSPLTREVETSWTIQVIIKNPDVVERITGPGGDEWRSHFYGDIETAEDVAEHFAYNALRNGIYDITRLDGWADCDENDVEIRAAENDTYTRSF